MRRRLSAIRPITSCYGRTRIVTDRAIARPNSFMSCRYRDESHGVVDCCLVDAAGVVQPGKITP
jgi:hypothetical protein